MHKQAAITCTLLRIIHRMVGPRTVQYIFTFRIRNSFVRSIPVNYRHQYYRHEPALEKLGVKNMGLKISPHSRYQTYFRQIHNVGVQNYEFGARGKQFNLGPLVLCGGMLLLNILPTFRRHCIRTLSDNPMTLMTYLSQTSNQTHRNDRYIYVTLNGRGNWALNLTYSTAGNSKHLRYVSNAANI